MCVIDVAGVAPCQCRCPGGHQITSPAWISSTGPPSHCVHPQPAVTTRIWPSGCMCHAERAPGSNVTLAHATRAGSGAVNSGSMRTDPVNHSAGPCTEGCEPLRFSCMGFLLEIRLQPGIGNHALSLYPVRKIHHTIARHSTRKPSVMAALTTTLTSEMP